MLRQGPELLNDPREFLQVSVRGGFPIREWPKSFEDQRECLRIEGEFVIVIFDHEFVIFVDDLQMTLFEFVAILTAEHRQQKLVVQLRFERIQSISKKSA